MQSLVPGELKRVLAVWKWSRKANPGSHDPKNLDAHSLARTLGAVFFAKGDVFRAAELAAEVSRSTLQSPLVLDVCRIWAATLAAALKGDTKPELLTMHAAQDALRNRQLKPPITALITADWRPTEPLDGAISLLASALDIFRFTNSFEAAIREAARSVSTCGALVGSLAGAHYGVRSVPAEWQQALAERDRLVDLARRFA
jgi:ADP-ribosylglycohydrolase